MKPLFVLALAVALTGAAAAQMTMQRIPNAAALRKVQVQSPAAVFASETPQMCAARNRFLLEKTTPALKAQLAMLQGEIADRRAHSYTCSPDLQSSISGNGGVADCGSFACNPIDGLCRTSAKTTNDCNPGYLWDGFRSCVPAPH